VGSGSSPPSEANIPSNTGTMNVTIPTTATSAMISTTIE